MREVDNMQDIIDSRDIIKCIEELESERESMVEDIEESEGDEELYYKQKLVEWDDENGEELETLKEFAEEASMYCDDWEHGAPIIREDHFTEYAEELARDIYGSEIDSSRWPFCHIDWERAAEELKMDYSCVDFDGVEYWVR